MRYLESPLQVLARQFGRSPAKVHGAEPKEARLADERLAVAEETCDYLEVLEEHLWMLLAHVEAVISDLESRYGYIRLQMLVGALYKRARELGADGEALESLAGYIDSICAATGDLFDLEVEDGRSALMLIERTIGY